MAEKHSHDLSGGEPALLQVLLSWNATEVTRAWGGAEAVLPMRLTEGSRQFSLEKKGKDDVTV